MKNYNVDHNWVIFQVIDSSSMCQCIFLKPRYTKFINFSLLYADLTDINFSEFVSTYQKPENMCIINITWLNLNVILARLLTPVTLDLHCHKVLRHIAKFFII